MDFEGFPKIARLNRDIIITEKIDGTNAQVFIEERNSEPLPADSKHIAIKLISEGGEMLVMYAGSRNRYITPGKDNYGFAKWVETHAEELFTLGPGRHFGEWWGQGIQRKYDLDEKRFSLFNPYRYEDRPACCGVVPILYEGMWYEEAIADTLYELSDAGSRVAPGFMKPEGVVVYHTHARTSFKVTFENDENRRTQPIIRDTARVFHVDKMFKPFIDTVIKAAEEAFKK